MRKSEFQQYFHCFIVCILFPYGILVPCAFWFSYQQNIVIIPIIVDSCLNLLDYMQKCRTGPVVIQIGTKYKPISMSTIANASYQSSMG